MGDDRVYHMDAWDRDRDDSIGKDKAWQCNERNPDHTSWASSSKATSRREGNQAEKEAIGEGEGAAMALSKKISTAW